MVVFYQRDLHARKTLKKCLKILDATCEITHMLNTTTNKRRITILSDESKESTSEKSEREDGFEGGEG